ncbi:hypothetical protein BH23DEI1_BH23DEI1_10470 [soil metagenome]|nr:hypothetical protein [Trueperaceae bacterium]
MLRSLVDLFIAFTDLLQAYAHEIQESAKKTALKVGVLLGLGIIALSAAMAAVVLATAALMWALFLVLLEVMAPAGASLVTGLIVFLLIGVVAWLAVRRTLR